MSNQIIPAQQATNLPILLWRMGLGTVIGQVVLLITTTGRRSGQPRRAVTEYFFVNGKKYVFADKESQWYQNLLANPDCTIQSAYGADRATMRKVTEPGELATVFAHLMQNRPARAEQIRRRFNLQAIPEDLVAVVDRLPLITFEPTNKETPVPLEADLGWMLPIIGLGFMIGWRLANRRRK